ncbi:scarecrow-like protein 14 [Mangifera indica]|uniref:scarecrow-like protein 14 n=1 Tax=Mangifera indica TaxID=29780 RepID=UPI001CF96CB0|nr:scarecrow-like protein 14 [Mangifera indica]
MIIDSEFTRFSSSMDGFNSYHDNGFPNSIEYPNFANGVEFDFNGPLDMRFEDNPFVPPEPDSGFSANSSSPSLEGESSSPSDDNDFSATFKYISEMLMEDDMEEKPCMFNDPLALQATEKNLYEIIGQKYPDSSDQPAPNVEIPDDYYPSCVSDHGSNSSPSSDTSHLVNPFLSVDHGEFKNSWLDKPIPSNFVFLSTSKSSSPSSGSFQNGFANNGNRFMLSPVSELLVPNLFSESELVSQFKKGAEEASKFLPRDTKLVVDLNSKNFAPEWKEKAPMAVVKSEKDEIEHWPIGFRGKKNHEREDSDLEEERSNKQSAVYIDDTELSEMFDKIVVCRCQNKFSRVAPDKTRQRNGETSGSNVEKNHAQKHGNTKETVDLRGLLIICAQAVSADDRKTAGEQLKQIRQHSSPLGDGTQRLAYCFANSLEARLAGTGSQVCTVLSSEKRSALDMLKAHQVYLEACPFNKIAIIFANHTYLELAEKATTLHIIDFGILYGFQWPALIFRLAKRSGGPPKLRITGIELPQRGFRPAERVQQTGRRLAKYCERLNVPFEYNAIAQKWESIKVEDLKIRSNEVVAVNCLFRFKNLLDETVVVNSPKNAVLNLIKKVKPTIFIHAVVNGSYNAPFFVTRFREALFHYSALFDMWDTNIDPEDQMRLMYEKEFYGREVMNVIACEGLERVERPETYKQWQVRTMRAGFRQLQLDPELLKKLRGKMLIYHNDFSVDQDGNWMLQGWKGRIINASSAWVPA